jgi:hypothetical protein
VIYTVAGAAPALPSAGSRDSHAGATLRVGIGRESQARAGSGQEEEGHLYADREHTLPKRPQSEAAWDALIERHCEYGSFSRLHCSYGRQSHYDFRSDGGYLDGGLRQQDYHPRSYYCCYHCGWGQCACEDPWRHRGTCCPRGCTRHSGCCLLPPVGGGPS